MARARETMTEWVVEALQQLGGRGTILEISRRVWDRHEPDIRAAGDLLYEWQYELRWAGDILRRDGILRPTEMCHAAYGNSHNETKSERNRMGKEKSNSAPEKLARNIQGTPWSKCFASQRRCLTKTLERTVRTRNRLAFSE